MTPFAEHAQWWLATTVTLDPWAHSAGPGTLLVGLGDGQADEAGVSLNHKGGAAGLQSVSAFVAGADALQWQRWRTRFGTPGAITRIVVEDLSLDTCMALLLFGRGLAGAILDTANDVAWCDYVTAWEQGHYRDGADLAASAACLVTALGHAHLPDALHQAEEGGVVAEGLRACLRLLGALTQGAPQDAASARGREVERAHAQLRYERQLYDLMLARAVRCQLMVPLAGSGRNVLVDALFLAEAVPSGVLKIMARTDTVHPWTHKGFTFLAIHRPGERGTGNDMVISVDPDAGLDLRNLWQALEDLENQRWDGARPAANPRRLASYRHPDDPARLRDGAPDQPWYDGGGSHTLLAAPKNVALDTPGSRLDWRADVVPAIWQLHFARQVAPYIRVAAVSVPAPGQAAGKRIGVVTRLASAAVHPDSVLLETPTFYAYLASLSHDVAPAASPFALPPAPAYEVLHLGACVAVVHRHGLTMLVPDEDPGAHAGLRDTAQQVAALHAGYQAFLDDYRVSLAAWQHSLAAHGAATPRTLHHWTHEIHAIKVRALAVTSGVAVLRHDYDENLLGDALQRVWGLSQQRGELEGSISRIDELMRHAIAARSERRQRLYGSILSGIGLGLLATHVWEPVKERLTTNSYEWQLMLFKETPAPGIAELRHIAHQTAFYETMTIAVIGGFALLGFLLSWFFGFKGEEHH